MQVFDYLQTCALQNRLIIIENHVKNNNIMISIAPFLIQTHPADTLITVTPVEHDTTVMIIEHTEFQTPDIFFLK